MPDIYVRTGPFDAPPAQGSLGDGSDPWAAFPDAPPTNGNAGDPWAAFPDAPTTHTPTHGSDPWAAFPDWPPTQAQSGGDADLFTAYPDAHLRFFASQAPGNAPWSVNDLPPTGALLAAPTSFSAAAPRPAAGDPWAAFPDWPPIQAQQGG